ncbi:hypothetical protein BJP40_10820 [Streptomyces sp. CC53]|nr:hypothetical protein BJP40_10820 [Streptomyces sp. CC53]
MVWTARAIGLRGTFWLMRTERMAVLGADPASRVLSPLRNAAFLAANTAGGLAGFRAAYAFLG